MTDLRELLSDIGDRAGRYDVTEQALALGRRRRQRRLAGTTAAVLAVAAAATWGLWPGRPGGGAGPIDPAESAAPSSSASTVALPASCEVARLPLPRGMTNGAATAVDPTGRYVVGSSSVESSATKEHLLLWDGDEVRRLDLRGQQQRFVAVASSGTALAETVLNERETSVWVYRDGTFTRLKGGEADAVGMNDSGVVVGTEIKRGPDGTGSAHPVRWRTPESAMERLPLPPGDWPDGVSVTGIDDDGTIVMNASRGRLDWHPFALRPDGTWQKLSAPPAVDGLPVVAPRAVAIRGGWVIGEARRQPSTPSGETSMVGVVWNLATGETVALRWGLGGPNVNAQGWTAAWLDGLWLQSPTGARLALPAPPEQTPDFPAYVSGLSEGGRVLVGSQQLNYDPDVLPLRWRCS